LAKRRTRRVALLLAIVWIVGVFDLTFTILARQIGNFEERNPVAAKVVNATGLLVVFKLATLAVSSAIFWKYRNCLLTEVSCWAVCAIHIILAFIWLDYYTGLP
jgi:hypothetical protein